MASDRADVWFSMYPADYLKDTLDLTLEEDGFYCRALYQVYINKGRIPSDPARLRRLLRVTAAQFKKNSHLFDRFFYRDGDCFGSKRADAEIAKANGNLEAARENGRKGGEKRWSKHRPPIPPLDTPPIIPPSIPPLANAWQNDSSSSSPSDPPYSPPPLFKTQKPDLYAAFGITQPSMTDENAMYEFFLEFKTKGATLDDLRQRIALYREKHPEFPLTPRAILRNWHSLIPPPPRPAPVDDGYVLDSFQEENA